MTKAYVYACSNDPCWRKIVKTIEDEFLDVDAGQWPAISDNQRNHLTSIKSKKLILIDVCQQLNIKDAVQSLRDQGWDHVVVVARSPSSVEARDVLYGNLSYDYWKKTYVISEIKAGVQICLAEMDDNQSLKQSDDLVASSMKIDYPRRECNL